MDTKQKYVILPEYNQIIIFNILLDHSKFKSLNPISAGFCYIETNKINCFGKSITLNLESNELDSFYATKQVFGIEAAEQLN